LSGGRAWTDVRPHACRAPDSATAPLRISFGAMNRGAPKVWLRRFEAADAAAVRRWFNNPAATATLMEQRESFGEADARGWVERATDDSGEDRKFAIMVEGHDEPVGFTALYGLFRQTAPELGALIGDDVRGRGVGRRAEALTIAKAFDEFGAHRVYGRIPADNEAAKRVVTSLGWRHEGTMRSHLRGEAGLRDCEIWGVLPEEFRAAAADLE
jgi:RimJ/RimL family protein N-acetyltransferase